MSEKTFLEAIKKMSDPESKYEELQQEVFERKHYEDDDELNNAALALEEEARKIAGLGPRRK